jgi:ferric-dicitrate binding protein FerR (iron transport regulator)
VVKDFERLGDRVADGLGGVPEAQFEHVRQSFIQRAMRAPRRQPRTRWLRLLAATAAGAALIGAAALTLVQRNDSAARAASAVTAEDLWLEGPKHGAPTRVELGSGAHVDLVAGTRSRVHRTRDGRTRVTLEGGVIEVMVSPGAGNSWSFFAGPYLAKTQGGEFFLNYQPSVGTIEAGVTSGSLRLSGGALGTDSVTLESGQRLGAADDGISVSSLDAAPESSDIAPP